MKLFLFSVSVEDRSSWSIRTLSNQGRSGRRGRAGCKIASVPTGSTSSRPQFVLARTARTGRPRIEVPTNVGSNGPRNDICNGFISYCNIMKVDDKSHGPSRLNRIKTTSTHSLQSLRHVSNHRWLGGMYVPERHTVA